MAVYDLGADDLELWLAGYLRGWLQAHDDATTFVSNVDPKAPREFQVRVRYDGGDPDSVLTEVSTFGITVTGPDSDGTGRRTSDKATLVRRGIIEIPLEDLSNPVVRVDSVPRFARVLGGDTSRPTRYCTIALVTLADQPT